MDNLKTHLQGIGKHKVLQAVDIRPGMVIVWNFGYTSTVVDTCISKTGKTVQITTVNAAGKRYTRKHAASTLLAVE